MSKNTQEEENKGTGLKLVLKFSKNDSKLVASPPSVTQEAPVSPSPVPKLVFKLKDKSEGLDKGTEKKHLDEEDEDIIDNKPESVQEKPSSGLKIKINTRLLSTNIEKAPIDSLFDAPKKDSLIDEPISKKRKKDSLFSSSEPSQKRTKSTPDSLEEPDSPVPLPNFPESGEFTRVPLAPIRIGTDLLPNFSSPEPKNLANLTPSFVSPQKSEYVPLKKVLNIILNQTIKRDTNNLFIEPPPTTHHDYYTKIKTPMFFSTMRQKLRNGEYTSLELFQKDFQLLCTNVATFFPLDSFEVQEAKRIFAVGKEMIKIFGSKIDPSKKLQPTQTAPPEPIRSPPKPAYLMTSPAVASSVTHKSRALPRKTNLNARRLPPVSTKFQSNNKMNEFHPGHYTPFIPRQKSAVEGSSNYYQNYVNNYLAFKLPSAPIQVYSEPVQDPLTLAHSQHTAVIESFLDTMDNSSLDMMNHFIDALRGGKYPSDLPGDVRDHVDALVKEFQDVPEPQQDILSDYKLLQELDQETGLKLSSSIPGEHNRNLQDQLDRNFEALYYLQLYQYERGKGVPSESEKNMATQLSKSLADISTQLPPLILTPPNPGKYLEDISKVNWRKSNLKKV